MKYLNSILLLFIFNLGYSQLSNWNIKKINDSDGLGQLSIRFCIPDDNNFLWIATELGIYVYDGLNVSVVTNKKYPELNNCRVKFMTKGNDGSILFQIDSENSMFRIKNNQIEKINNQKILFLEFNNYLTINHSLFKTLIIYHKEFLSPDYSQLSFSTKAVTFKDRLFVFSKKKNSIIAISKNKKPKYYQIEKPNIDIGYFYLLQFNDKLVFIAKNKLLLFDKDLNPLKIVCDKNIKKIICDDILLNDLNNNLITGDKLNYIINYKKKHYKIELINNRLISKYLFESPSSNLTKVTYNPNSKNYACLTNSEGIYLLKEKKIKNIFVDNYDDNYIYNLVYKKNKWFTNKGWVYDFKKNKISFYNIENFSGNMRFLLEYQNDIYYESRNLSLTSLLNLKKGPIHFQSNLKYLTSYTYLDSKLWVANETKVSYLNKDSLVIEPFLDNLFFKNRRLNSLNTFNNNLVLATTKGVFIFNPKAKKIAILKKLEKVNARYIKIIDKNSFWVGCYGDGLFLIRNNKAFKVVDKNIELNTAHAIEEDLNGNLWISTNNGLLNIKKSILIKNTLNHQLVECYRFSTDDGLLTNEFNGGSTHPSLQNKEGIIGFSSMKGIVWFNPNEVNKHLFNSKIFIDKILANNITNINLKKNYYSIPKFVEVLTINFSYCYYFNRENLTVSYRFEDQTKWTEIRGNSFQISRYKKGNQKLLIRITTHGFDENQGQVKSINLNFEPRYYETLWFWLLISILLISLTYISYLLGLNLKKKNEIQLKNKIDERTSELRNVILELENSKITISESLNEKNILLKEVHHRVKNNLQLVMSLLNIQASDKENTSIEEFIIKGRARIASMVLIHENLYQREDVGNIDFETFTASLVNNIRTTFGGVSDIITIKIKIVNIFFDIQTSIPLGLIINELVTNSFKYGFPNGKTGQITISIEQISDINYKLVIEDTGIGFTNEKVEKKSIGLELVSLLALQLKGKLTIDSKNGTAFEIIFAIK